MAAATQKEGDLKPTKKVVEEDMKQRGELLVIKELSTNAWEKSYPLVEQVGTKSV